MRRKDERHYRVELFDGRATATVVIVDGYDRPVSPVFFDAGPVHAEAEAIAEAKRHGLTAEATR